MKAEITRQRINQLKSRPDCDSWLWDTKISGFGVKVTKAGVKSYYFQYRMGGRATPTRRLFLGRCAWTSLENARDEAGQARSNVHHHLDPFELSKEKMVQGATFEVVAVAWLDKHSESKKKCKHGAHEDWRIVIQLLCPAFKGREAARITPEHVQAFLTQYATRPAQSNRILGVLKRIFAHGVKKFSLPSNPADDEDITRFKATKRERHLLPDELQRFITTLDACEKNGALHPSFLALIRLLLFTGCRKDEIRKLQWKQINLSDKSLRLHQAKTGPRTVYLNSIALGVIKKIPRFPKKLFVIVSPTGRGYLGNTTKPWEKLCELAKLSNFKLHDLRHTFASVGADIEISLLKMGKLLGHSNETMTARYSHLETRAQREATELIAQEIERTVAEK